MPFNLHVGDACPTVAESSDIHLICLAVWIMIQGQLENIELGSENTSDMLGTILIHFRVGWTRTDANLVSVC